MAALERPYTALEYARRFVKSIPFDQDRVGLRVLNTALRTLWMAAPWRWTVGTLTAIPLVSGTQDYTLVPPSDYVYTIHGRTSDGDKQRDIEIVPSLPTDVLQSGQLSMVSYQGSNIFRCYPKPIVAASPTTSLLLWYKKSVPVITNQNMHTAGVQIFDDEWFHVYEAGVLWQAFIYADDQRAGSVSLSGNGQPAFTGQRAIFEAGLNDMRAREPIPIWTRRQVPDEKEANR